MLTYMIRRVLSMIPSLFLAAVLIFSFMHFIPGDPAAVMLGDHATPEQIEQLRESMGLNKPLHIQFIRWITGVLSGNLGNSIFFQIVWQ